ncbi:MAG: fibro-slime domain-containing protein [Polyangia bacterium]
MRATKAVYIVLAISRCACVGIIACGCSPSESGPPVGGTGQGGISNTPGMGGGGGNSGGVSGSILTISQPPSFGGQGGTSTETTVPWPPPGFVNVTAASIGDYATAQDPVTSPDGGSGGGSGSTGQASCTNILFGVVRDFKMSTQGGTNPDFEHSPADDRGIVLDTLGSDGKPVYGDHPNGTATTHGADDFNQWYNDVDGVNIPYVVALQFVQSGSIYTFAATIGNTGGVPDVSYFPLDGLGFNDTALGADGKMHNFSFTTEIHTSFTYNGGEVFTFKGDDDVWVFINNNLAIDLGGIHAQETQSVNLDSQASNLGITKGNSYSLAVFNAERHVNQSNFRIDTSLTFTNCGFVEGTVY